MVLVGDNRQLPAILQGGLFRELYERARPDQKVVLTEIMRQREAWAREAISQVGQGEAAKALKTFEEKNRLHVLPTKGESERGLIDRWKERGISDPQNNLILASTNAEVARLNREAKAARLEAGKLGLRSVEVGDERVHEGDRILFMDTKKNLGILKSQFGTVTHIDWLTRKLTVEVDGEAGRKPVTFSLREFDAIRLGYAATVHRAQGMTLDQNVYTLLGGSMQNREMTYVQISRARGETHLFSDEKTAGQDRDELTRMVSRSEEKLSAHAVAREKRQEVSRDERREEVPDRRGERGRRHDDMRDLALTPKEVRGQREEREQRMGLELML